MWLQDRVVGKSWQPFQAEVQVQKRIFFHSFIKHIHSWSHSVRSLRAQALYHSLPVCSVHRIFQERILEWVAISFSKGIFLSQGWKLGLPHYRQVLYHLSYQGSPVLGLCRIKSWPHYPSAVHFQAGYFHPLGLSVGIHKTRVKCRVLVRSGSVMHMKHLLFWLLFTRCAARLRTDESHDFFGGKVVRVIAGHPALEIPRPRAQQDSHRRQDRKLVTRTV